MSQAGTQEPPVRPAFQFRLRHLFAVTTASAVIAAVAAAKGPGTLPLTIGLALAWWNVRGRFQWLQTRGCQAKAFRLAWALFVGSLLLPAAEGCNKKPVYGWEAAYLCARVQAGAVAAGFTEQDQNRWPLFSLDMLLFAMLNLANLSVLLSPFFLGRLQRNRKSLLPSLLAVSLVGVWLVAWSDDGLRIGYYVWCGGITCLFLACPLGPRTFAAMLLIAGLLVARTVV